MEKFGSTLGSTRPSPSMVVAVVALVFAMVGSAVAGTAGLSEKITKSKVKKVAAAQATKVLDQREGSLDVNSAKTADSATTAQNATNAQNATSASNVNGNSIRSIRFLVSEGTAPNTVILDNFHGLTLTAACAAGPTLTVTATSSVNAAQLQSYSVSGVNVTNEVSEDFFDAGDSENLLPDEFEVQNGKTEFLNPNGNSVSLTWAADAIGGDVDPDCEFNGHAIGG